MPVAPKGYDSDTSTNMIPIIKDIIQGNTTLKRA